MKFSDSFKFQIPGLQYSQEQAPQVQQYVDQKGARQEDILKGFLGIIPKVQKKVRVRETKQNIASVKAGYMARQKALAQDFKKLRQDKTIGQIDDPFFQRGLALAEGELKTVAFGEQLKTYYDEGVKNPNFFENPDAFEAGIKAQFDLAYTGLPQNVDTQEGFLGKISPIVAGMTSKYKKDSNIYFGKKDINNQDGLTGAALFNHSNNLSLITEGTDPEILEYASNVPDTSGMTAPEARNYFKNEIFNDLVDDLNTIGDNLNSNYDENTLADLGYAAGVTSADIQLDFITKQIDDPHLGLRVLNKLKSGTGKLKDTEKGKAALNKIWAASKKQAAIDYEKNTARQYSTLVSEVGNFDVYLTDNGFNLAKGQEELEKRIDELYPPEKYSKNNNRERMRLNNSIARYKRSQSSGGMTAAQQAKAKVQAGVNSIFTQVPTTPMNPSQASQFAQAIGSQIDVNSSVAKAAVEETLKVSHTEFIKDPENPAAATGFWNNVGVLNNLNTEQGTNMRPFRAYSSESNLKNDPTKLSILYEANSKGYLDTFVDEDSRIGKAIRGTGQDISSDPAIFSKVFSEEIKRLEGLEEVDEFETIYDVDFSKIPTGITDTGTAETISSREVVPEFVSNSGKLNGVYPAPVSNRISQSYFTELNKNRKTMSEEDAIDAATATTEDRYSVETLIEINSPWLSTNDKLLYIQDGEGDNLIGYLDDISGGDEEQKEQGISAFIESVKNTNRAGAGLLFTHDNNINKKYVLQEAPAMTERQVAFDIENLVKRDREGKDTFAAYMESDKFMDALQNSVTNWMEEVVVPTGTTSRPAGRIGSDKRRRIANQLKNSHFIPFGSLEYSAETPLQVAQHYAKEIIISNKKLSPDTLLQALALNSNSDYFKVAGTKWQDGRREQIEEHLINTVQYNSDLTDNQLNEVDNDNFDWDNNVQIAEIQDGIFTLVDEDSKYLRYTEDKFGKVLFTREDIGKFVHSDKFASSEYIWDDIKDVIDPKGEPKDNVEMIALTDNFFTNSFPSQPTDEDFVSKFGDNAFTMKMFHRRYLRRGGATK